MLSSIFTSGVIILVIMFQPELRRAFENLGRGHFFDNVEEELDAEKNVSELVKVADNLSRRRVGALMVLTPGVALTMGIRDIINSDYLSGTIRLVDALLVAGCLAVGVTLGYTLLSTVTGVVW